MCEAGGKILDLAIFSCQEGTSASNWKLPLLWPFSLAVLNVSLMCAHLCTYPAKFYYSSSVWEWDQTKVERIIMSQHRLKMVQPWPDQPDRFWFLWLYAETVQCMSNAGSVLEIKLCCEILLLLNIAENYGSSFMCNYMRLFSWRKTFCDLFLLLFFSFLYCHLGMVREKVGGGAKGKTHGQLFCSHKTKNHHKLKCFQVKL